jgi:hypothetical protein
MTSTESVATSTETRDTTSNFAGATGVAWRDSRSMVS